MVLVVMVLIVVVVLPRRPLGGRLQRCRRCMCRCFEWLVHEVVYIRRISQDVLHCFSLQLAAASSAALACGAAVSVAHRLAVGCRVIVLVHGEDYFCEMVESSLLLGNMTISSHCCLHTTT